jgi:predicted MPP superfamily phosphohydrolase
VPLRGTPINIAGVEQTVPRGGDLHGTLAQADANAPTILLAHYPSTAFQLAGNNVQLVLSGHTHGGQIRLPWVGCIWPNDLVPRRMASGLHVVNNVHVHVSAGIGVSLPLRVRFHCPPEIAILTMHSKTEPHSLPP